MVVGMQAQYAQDEGQGQELGEEEQGIEKQGTPIRELEVGV